MGNPTTAQVYCTTYQGGAKKFTYDVVGGTPNGPYIGQFHEKGTVNLDANGNLTSLKASFQIFTKNAYVDGTKTQTRWEHGAVNGPPVTNPNTGTCSKSNLGSFVQASYNMARYDVKIYAIATNPRQVFHDEGDTSGSMIFGSDTMTPCTTSDFFSQNFPSSLFDTQTQHQARPGAGDQKPYGYGF